jgi:hypothetical protein
MAVAVDIAAAQTVNPEGRIEARSARIAPSLGSALWDDVIPRSAGRQWIVSRLVFVAPRILAKVDPSTGKPAVATHPPPRPSREPSLLYRKLRGGRRRR